MDTLIRSGKAALVAVIPEDQQINDTINVLPHTACNVPGCNKPMQPTTPEEDTDMLFRGERESAPSPESDAGNLTGNQHGDTDELDPNPYTPKLLDLKREPQDADLEEVLNQEIKQPTIEDRILEVRLIMEEDHELREREISGVLQIMDQGQNEMRENIKIILGALNENKESFQAQTNVMKEAFTLLNRQMANQLRGLSKCISEQMAELAQEIRAAITPPPPPESFYTSPMGEVRHMTTGTAEEVAEILARSFYTSPTGEPTLTTDPITTPIGDRGEPRVEPVIGISKKPSRDSYVEGNSLIYNLGASGVPLKCSQHGDTSTPSTEVIKLDLEVATKSDTRPEPIRDPDTYMINNAADCQQGLNVSKYTDANPGAGVAEMSVMARVVEAAKNKLHQPKTRRWNRPRPSALDVGGFNGKFQEASRLTPEEEDTGVNAFLSQDIVEAEVTAAMEKKEKEEQTRRHPETATPLTSHRQATPPAIGARQQQSGAGAGANAIPITPGKAPRRPTGGTPVKVQTTPLQIAPGTLNSTEVHHVGGKPDKATHTGTGANATPIGPSQRQMTPRTLQLTEGKPGRVQRTRPGDRRYWNPGLENTADIESVRRTTSVQVLISGCPTVPGRGEAWKKSFLAGFNAKRERLAPNTPICATQVSFARSYPRERVITIHHPPKTRYPEIIRVVARVCREMYNTNIQHLDDSMTSIL
ncbi:hypothetical protein L211DRAFT_851705 [Terfezia boudieri ATCC MYA-4762]|uniref:Uncharacterized protein n=1 Tax=Terfezia boudieri ATCC MYA-4762 TaxID=1051890 RepID=A0A3N4LE77_9PEZI|nr:hypothetical protein L211DRAFT_851705 [Terfezia boudieri ATCC MYA-4762]